MGLATARVGAFAGVTGERFAGYNRSGSKDSQWR